MFRNATSDRQGRKRRSMPVLRLFEILIVFCSIVMFGYAMVVGFASPNETPSEADLPVFAGSQEKDYSKFTHSNQFHSRLPCLLCHTRNDNSARIGFPGKTGHLPCAGCHALQFADNKSPICTICHTTTGMKKFPSLRSFGARFDHSRHTRVNCAVCHKAEGRGVARSIPSGPSAHQTCFQCHTANAPNSMASCSVCHMPGRLARTPEWAVSFRKSFSHAKHLGSMNCATCHSIRAGLGRGKQMSVPLASMHFAPERSLSCGGCHNGKRAFGPDDFSNCKRCHSPRTFRF